MNKTIKILIVLALIVAVWTVIAAKQQKNAVTEPAASVNVESSAKVPAELPRMVDLGADKCIPCKMMKPILDELKQNYKEKFEVIFIDVWENQAEAVKYKINLIPTQIFYSADGKELFRHEGFYSKEEILAKWKELRIEL